jgi:hypothetical protein
MIPVYVGGGVGVAGLIGAIVFVIQKGNAQSSANSVDATIRQTATSRNLNPTGICSSTAKGAADFAGACSTYKSDLDQVNQDATAANVSGVLAGLGVAFAAGWYLFSPKAGDDAGAPAAAPSTMSSLSVSPVVGYGTNGFSVSGRF